jgi:response regulator RpfG family c-di-GMP phosphodiesterase
MKPEIYIVCVEDEPDVLEAIVRDLAAFEDCFRLEGFASAAEAMKWIEALNPESQRVALIYCDHVMPGQRGVEFMTELQQRALPALKSVRKVLFTGQAGHQETIAAINEAGVCHYQAKPWDVEELTALTRKLLTDYVIERQNNPLPYMAVLDQARVAEALHDNNPIVDA